MGFMSMKIVGCARTSLFKWRHFMWHEKYHSVELKKYTWFVYFVLVKRIAVGTVHVTWAGVPDDTLSCHVWWLWPISFGSYRVHMYMYMKIVLYMLLDRACTYMNENDKIAQTRSWKKKLSSQLSSWIGAQVHVCLELVHRVSVHVTTK